MRKLVVTLVGIAVLLVTGSGIALAQSTPSYQSPAPSQTQPAQPAPAGQFPKVSGLKAFAPEANFMSLPGYLRYLMHQQTGQWLTYAEATRAVQQGQ